MKKIIILNLAFLFPAIFNYTFGENNSEQITADEPLRITTLIINADVTVILVNNDDATLQVIGANSLSELITLNRNEDTLVIGSTRDRDLKEVGAIYVPSSAISKILINSDASIRTIYSLYIPQLDVVCNGACKLAISNFGKVNISGTDSYSIEQMTTLIPHPANMVLKKN